jgi:hypothetical protein
MAPSFRFKNAMRSTFNVLPTNWILDRVLESATFRRMAQVTFFHHRGLFSFEAWRDMLSPAKTC